MNGGTSDAEDLIRLILHVPGGLFADERVTRLSARDLGGSFGILPHHIDCVKVLVPGLMSYTKPDGEEQFLGIDEGVLVKCGLRVTASTRNAVSGPDLGELRRRVARQFEALDEQERKVRTALARMEADFVRQFLKLKD